MTGFPPAEPPSETWLEKQIREAMDETPIHLLPGSGEPIADLGGHDSPDWWAKRFLERERAIERDREISEQVKATLRFLWRLPDEAAVRSWVENTNQAIASLGHGSGSEVLDLDDILDRWRRAKG